MRERSRWCHPVAVSGLALLAAACSKQSQFRVVNDTPDEVTIVACAQDPHLNRVLPSGASLSFSDDVGFRTLPDDAGFACAVQRGNRLLCLPVPTDQSKRSRFVVSAASPVTSESACFAESDPHL